MKVKYQNDRCPVCGTKFDNLDEEGEFICLGCYTTLKVKRWEKYSKVLKMVTEWGYYIDPDDYRPVEN